MSEGAPSFGSRAVSAARSSVLVAPLVAVSGLFSTVVIARTLDAHAFAIYAVAISVRATMQFISDMGTGSASTRGFAELYEAGARRQAVSVFYRLAALRLAFVVTVAAFAVLAPDAVRALLQLAGSESDVVSWLIVLATAEGMASLGVFVLAGTLNHRMLNAIALAYTILNPVLVVTAAAADAGLSGIVAAVATASSVRCVALYVCAVRVLLSGADAGARVEGLGRTFAGVAGSSILGKTATWAHSRQLVSFAAPSTVGRTAFAPFALAYDLVTQIFVLVAAPVYSLLLPSFAGSAGDPARLKRLYQLALRTLTAMLVPVAAALAPAFGALADVAFDGRQGNVSLFGTLFAVAFAAETIVSGPATAMALARDELQGIYRRNKLVMLVCAASYAAIAAIGMLGVAIVMVVVRLGSALALTAAITRRAGLAVDGRWASRAVLEAIALGALSTAVVLRVPGTVLDLPAAVFAVGAVHLALLGPLRLLETGDAALAGRLLPGAGGLAERFLAPSDRRKGGR